MAVATPFVGVAVAFHDARPPAGTGAGTHRQAVRIYGHVL